MEYNGKLGVITEEITINVVDQNRHMPRFEKHPQLLVVTENSTIGSLVYKFTATDRDGDNITFRLSHFGEPLFRMGLHSGELLVNKQLDYEDQPISYIVVSASDGTYTRSTPVTIKLVNINDNKPYFPRKNYSVSIVEIRGENKGAMQQQQHHKVIEVQAIDKDPGSKIKLEIVSGDKKDLFEINETAVYAKQYLSPGKYRLTIAAMDEGGLQSDTNAEVSIEVLTNPYKLTTTSSPLLSIFEKRFYEVSVKETLDVGAILFRFDIPPPRVTFELREIVRRKRPFFKIDQSGTIILTSKLDLDDAKIHHLVISACVKKSGECKLCHLTVKIVEDENAFPRFRVKRKRSSLLYTTQANSLITSLEFRGNAKKKDIRFVVNTTDGERVETYLKISEKSVQLFLNSSITNTTLQLIKFEISIIQEPDLLIDKCTLRIDLTRSVAALQPSSSSIDSSHMQPTIFDFVRWKYMVPLVSLIIVLTLLVIVLVVLYRRVKRFLLVLIVFSINTNKLTEISLYSKSILLLTFLRHLTAKGRHRNTVFFYSPGPLEEKSISIYALLCKIRPLKFIISNFNGS